MNNKNSTMSPVVSVIIPVYNVERYMDKCIESVQNQTLKNIEIILVDDGSTDSSGDKCDLYLSDKRVRVIHKKNGGLSEARNAGVEVATAQYIGFVDSDDYIETDMYEVLYKRITETESDIAFCGIYSCYTDRVVSHCNEVKGTFVTDAETAIDIVLQGHKATLHSVDKLYKKCIIKKHPFLVGKTYEDAHFIIPYLADIKRAVFDMAPKYYYVHREGSITTRSYRKSDFSVCEAHYNNRKIIEERYPALLEKANFRYYWSLFYVLDKMLSTEENVEIDDKTRIVREIRKNYKEIMKNPLIGRGRKIAASGLMINEIFYKLCLTAYTRKNKKLFKK